MVEERLEIPQGITMDINGLQITVKGPKGEITRIFKVHELQINKQDNFVVLQGKKLSITRTIKSHINNMFIGVKEGYEKHMKVVFSHFPISLTVKNNKLEIKNFIGEKNPRFAKIVKNSEVQINGQDITIKGVDKESVGQTAANLMTATKIKKLDPRVFQDGIYPKIE
ncbi:50S ribosomal protein L6 [Candidatus Micrarchaeota archaeon]|jgi:large subunit ribosomal protein L6|nr:50S ribosomal protein L6 [Candidatus Micrarchaeota archaeon]